MSDLDFQDDHQQDLVTVKLPSGGLFNLYEREKKYFDDRVKRYLADNLFTNVADLQELDRVVMLELFCWRWGSWLSQQQDYWGDTVDEKDLSKYLKDTSSELRALKAGLGIDKVSRDKVKGEGSVDKYIENLRIRAKEFGVMREDQLGKCLELWADLRGRVQRYQNCTEDERKELRTDWDDVFNWLVDDAIPQFDAIDEYFRKHKQQFWIRDQ